MKSTRARKLYSNLSGAERFRLVMQAGARGDIAEAHYLLDTCPRVIARTRDPEFQLPMQGSAALADALSGFCGPYLGMLSLLEILEDELPTELLAGDPSNLEAAPLVLTVPRDHAARTTRTFHDAFAAVCESRLGLEPDVVLAVHAPLLKKGLDQFAPLMAAAVPEPEEARQARELMEGIWRAATPPPQGTRRPEDALGANDALPEP